MSPEKWLTWADRAYFGFAIIAAIATGLTIVAGIAQNRFNSRISAQKDRDLAAFQGQAAAKLLAASTEIAGLTHETEQLKGANLKLSVRLAELMTLGKIDSDAVTKAAQSFPGTKFDISVFAPDPEAESLAIQIDEALVKAGWLPLPWTMGSVAITRLGKPTWGINMGTGAGVLVDTDQTNWPTSAVVAALRLTIPNFGFQSSNGAPIALSNHGALHFVIGKKPIPTDAALNP